MKEKLQSIIDQRVTGNDAVVILRSALKELAGANTQFIELGQLIGQAEDIFIYGKKGRPMHKTFR